MFPAFQTLPNGEWDGIIPTNILAIDGSVSAPSYSFLADTDTGLYRRAANTLSVAASGSLIAEWTSNGYYTNRVRPLNTDLSVEFAQYLDGWKITQDGTDLSFLYNSSELAYLTSLGRLHVGATFSPVVGSFSSFGGSLTQTTNVLGGVQYRNTNAGSSAEMRFVVCGDTTDYLAFSHPGSGNTDTSIFGIAKNSADFIFTNGSANRDLMIGTFSTGDLLFGANNIIELKHDVSTGYLVGNYSSTFDNFVLDATSGAIKLNAGLSRPITTVSSATHTVSFGTDAYLSVTYTGTGAVTITLPDITSAMDGYEIPIKDAGYNASNFNITINADATDTIENAASSVISGDGDAITIKANSSTNNWEIF